MEVVHTYHQVKNTKATAELFRTALIDQKGTASDITKIRDGHRVTASDGQAVDFLKS